MICDSTELRERLRPATQLGHIALDTEFFWERTYYPRLGVVQVGFSREDCFLIDALELPDLAPLGEVLADEKVVKILHDPIQDLTILRRVTGATPHNVFDTRLAAGFVGLSSTCSLKDLAGALVGAELTNEQTRSDWLRRPLSDKQIEYALNDVRYLSIAREILLDRARRAGREDWVAEEMAACDDEHLYAERDPYEQGERMKGAGKLSARRKPVLRELAAWREHQARELDVPRGRVIEDAVLVNIAWKQPTTPAALERVRGDFDRAKYGEAVLEAVKRGLQAQPEQSPPPGERTDDDVLGARVDFALAYMKGKMLGSGVDPKLAASRADITAVVAAGADADPSRHALLRGWRREFLGEELLALLEGRKAVRLDPKTGLPELVSDQ